MLLIPFQEEMMVTQLQYTAWPDHDVPKSAAPLIEMNKTLRALQTNKQQQILIHCRSVKVMLPAVFIHVVSYCDSPSPPDSVE